MKIEFLNANPDDPTRPLIACIRDTHAPPVAALVSIRKQAWRVVRVTYCVDDADELNPATIGNQLRACVYCEKAATRQEESKCQ